MQQPTELDAFADACERLPPSPADYGYRDQSARGAPWHGKISPHISYNHVLPPNRPGCSNGGWTVGSCYPANSMHPGGANVLYGDSRVEFASEAVDRQVWRELGSRMALSQADKRF
jgi:prepilin-type processing-associated H-X9-DG protein